MNGVIKKIHVSGRLKQNLINILSGKTNKGPMTDFTKYGKEAVNELAKKAVDKMLDEMAVEYDPQHPERMHPKVQSDIEKEKTLYGKHPAFPKMSSQDKQKFAELISSKRFKDVVEKVKRYAGQNIGSINDLLPSLFSVLMSIVDIEKDNREQLERLAVKLVMQDNNIKQGEIEFDVKLVDMGQNNLDKVKIKLQQEDPIEATEDMANLDLEVAKRRFINGLIHGAAEKGQYMFHLVEDELKSIDPDLPNMYGLVQSLGDYMYWIIPDMVGAQADDEAPPPAGMSKIEKLPDGRYKVTARAVNFPLLIHETTKGVMEVISLHGLPRDKDVAQKVLTKADFLDAEMWDMRFGPGLWEKFVDVIGVEDQEIRSYLYGKIVSMPAAEFHDFMSQLMSGSKDGKRKLVALAKDIRDDIKKQEYEDGMKRAKDDLKNIDEIAAKKAIEYILNEQVLKKIPLSNKDKFHYKLMTGNMTDDELKSYLSEKSKARLIIQKFGDIEKLKKVLLDIDDGELMSYFIRMRDWSNWPEFEKTIKDKIAGGNETYAPLYYSYLSLKKNQRVVGTLEVPDSHPVLGKNLATDRQKKNGTEIYEHPDSTNKFAINTRKDDNVTIYVARVYKNAYPEFAGRKHLNAYRLGTFLDKEKAYDRIIKSKQIAEKKLKKNSIQ